MVWSSSLHSCLLLFLNFCFRPCVFLFFVLGLDVPVLFLYCFLFLRLFFVFVVSCFVVFVFILWSFTWFFFWGLVYLFAFRVRLWFLDFVFFTFGSWLRFLVFVLTSVFNFGFLALVFDFGFFTLVFDLGFFTSVFEFVFILLWILKTILKRNYKIFK